MFKKILFPSKIDSTPLKGREVSHPLLSAGRCGLLADSPDPGLASPDASLGWFGTHRAVRAVCGRLGLLGDALIKAI
jgi:hypothetical protein